MLGPGDTNAGAFFKRKEKQMVKKTLTYTDYNGTKRTEDFYFNLSKAEMAEMEMSVNGGLSDMLTNIVNAHDMPSIIKIFKEILLKTYGVKTPDGRFEKSEELSKKFSETAAYSDLFMLLATDAKEAAHFINNVVPDDTKMSPDQIAALTQSK